MSDHQEAARRLNQDLDLDRHDRYIEDSFAVDISTVLNALADANAENERLRAEVARLVQEQRVALAEYLVLESERDIWRTKCEAGEDAYEDARRAAVEECAKELGWLQQMASRRMHSPSGAAYLNAYTELDQRIRALCPDRAPGEAAG